jgi:hypothetical protein
MAAAAPVGAFVAKHLGTIIAGTGAVGGAAAALRKPSMPEVKSPVPMPDQAAAEAAKRRRFAQERSTSGRAATILGGGERSTLG